MERNNRESDADSGVVWINYRHVIFRLLDASRPEPALEGWLRRRRAAAVNANYKANNPMESSPCK